MGIFKSKKGWYFPDNIGGQEEGFENQGINQFKSSPYGKLAREIIQNSYDARESDNGKVRVEFSLLKIEKDKIPNVNDIQKAINACAEYSSKSARLLKFCQAANRNLEKEYIDVLKISDYNTTGLYGIEEKDSAWYGLIKSSGSSPKEGATGGSYGSGKHAAFVFSYLRTIFYGTYVKEEGFAFQGKSILASHKMGDTLKSNVGYWGNMSDRECKPVRNSKDIDKIFLRDEPGTDLYIIGAKLESDMWMKNILYSVIENFWKLIITDKLEVKILDNTNDILIDSKNVRELAQIGKKEKVKIDDKDTFNAYKFIELYDDQSAEIRLGSICEENDVELKIAKIPEYHEKKILKMRSTEMKINIFSPRKRPVDFIGILSVKGERLNKFLRESEPQTHDSWDADNIDDEFSKKEIKAKIKKLDKWIDDQIASLVYVDTESQFDVEGLDFLNGEDYDDPDIEGYQKPFDEIQNEDKAEIEILAHKTLVSKSAYEETEEGETLEKGEGNKTIDGGQNDNNEWSGNNPLIQTDGFSKAKSYHEVRSIYVRTPYDDVSNKYRILIKTDLNIEEGMITFQRYTDSGELEKLNIRSATMKDKELTVEGNSIQNVKIPAKINEIFEVEFETAKKCIMEVKVYVQI